MNAYELCNYFYVLPEFVKTKAKMIKRNDKYAQAIAELGTCYNIVL